MGKRLDNLQKVLRSLRWAVSYDMSKGAPLEDAGYWQVRWLASDAELPEAAVRDALKQAEEQGLVVKLNDGNRVLWRIKLVTFNEKGRLLLGS